MGEATDGSRGGCKTRGARVCRLAAMALALTGSQAPVAAALPRPAVPLGVLHNDRTLIAAAGDLTLSVKDIDAEPGSDTPIAVKLPSEAELRAAGAEQGTYLLIRNLPEGVSVSAGMATGHIRVVPLHEVPTLRLISKPSVNAQFQLKFRLIGRDNRLLAETTATVKLSPIQDVAALAPVAPEVPKPLGAQKPQEGPKPQEVPKPPEVQKPQVPSGPQAGAEPLTPRAEAVLLARGQEVMQQGGIAAARLIFQALATRGSAAGALALARSYDPAYVVPSAVAPELSLTEARKWYERAAELGDPDAKRRLAEIPSSP